MHTVKPYGTAIHEAIASGDQTRMRQAVQAAEDYLRDAEEVRAALAELRQHLQKSEHKS